jgi:aspartate-semialdehyde dehydrogenase
VSGAGLAGYNDLKDGMAGDAPKKFPYPIFSNLIPQIDVFADGGYTKEELKMIHETKKILGDDSLKITATTVRVPIFNGHSESINIEFLKPCTLEGIRECFENAPGIILYDDIAGGKYPMPHVANDKDEVYVGRIRLDDSVDSGCNIFVVADNIRKGAATNTIQICELLMNKSGK